MRRNEGKRKEEEGGRSIKLEGEGDLLREADMMETEEVRMKERKGGKSTGKT